MDVASRVTRYVATDPIVVDAVADTKTIRYHRGKAAETDSWTGEGASREDVMVDGGVSWVSVQTGQSLALWGGQVSHREQVTVETLTWREVQKEQLVKELFSGQHCV